MFFNATLLYSLTLTSYYGSSPFFSLSPQKKSGTFQLKDLKFSYFLNNALKVDYLNQNLFIDGSIFSNFLSTAIFIRSESEVQCIVHPITTYYNTQAAFVSCVHILNTTFISNDSGYNKGGAVNCVLSDQSHYLKIDRCNFTNCKAQEQGGAIYFVGNMDSTQVNTISFCNFIGCFVNKEIVLPNGSKLDGDVDCKGGSVYCCANSVNFRNSTFNSSKIIGNGKGGAIYANVKSIQNDTFLTTFTNCLVSGDDSYGGALYIELSQKAPYNMSYIIFDNCNATQGQCVYATNISSLNINYTSLTNITKCMLMVDKVDFNFKIDRIILNDGNISKLIDASTYSNPSTGIGFHLYHQPNLNIGQGVVFFDYRLINNTFVISHDINDYHGYPFISPLNASTPLDEALLADIPTEIVPPVISPPINQDPIITNPQDQVVPPPVQPQESYTNTEDAAAAAVVADKGGLSTLAIIFIIIACLIVVIGIIILIIFFLRRNGRCRCGQDEPALAVRSSTYF